MSPLTAAYNAAVIGRTVSHYNVLGHLGAGGMGTVWLAEDTKLHRRVALKFLAAEAPPGEAFAERLLREARLASALDHPHIGTIYEVGEFEGQPFIAMAYYQGETLAERLKRGALPIVETARIVADVADALSAAHAAGIVHRDLKPSNLMLTASGQAKVLDFGIATFSSTDAETMARLTGPGGPVGTAAYMSPEQAAGEDVDWRSDLWSLGIVTREMLTGRPVFAGANVFAVMHAVTTTTPAPVRGARPDVASELEEITVRTMVRDRVTRTITAADVRDLAASCHARLSSGVAPTPRRSARSKRVWIAVAVFAAVVLAVRDRMVGTVELEGAMGTGAGAARNHSAGRSRPVLTTRFASPWRRAAISRTTPCSPSRSARSRARRPSTRNHPAQTSSTVHMDGPTRPGGRSAGRQSRKLRFRAGLSNGRPS